MAYERVNCKNLPSTNTPVNADNLNKIDEGIANAVKKSDLLNLIYPVGSIYMSVNNTNPANLFGGKWEQIKDRFLLACGDTYSNGSTGGEAKHTLTVDEMPAHNHAMNNNNGAGNSTGYAVLNGWELVHGDENYWNFNNPNMWTSYKGGSQPHNNMPPYLAVYIWQRTA